MTSPSDNLRVVAATTAKDRIIEALQEEAPLTTTAIKSRTGLSRGTTIKYLEKLTVDGLIQKQKITESAISIYSLPGGERT